MDSFYGRLAADADDDWDITPVSLWKTWSKICQSKSKGGADGADIDDLLDGFDFGSKPKAKAEPPAQSALDTSFGKSPFKFSHLLFQNVELRYLVRILTSRKNT